MPVYGLARSLSSQPYQAASLATPVSPATIHAGLLLSETGRNALGVAGTANTAFLPSTEIAVRKV